MGREKSSHGFPARGIESSRYLPHTLRPHTYMCTEYSTVPPSPSSTGFHFHYSPSPCASLTDILCDAITETPPSRVIVCSIVSHSVPVHESGRHPARRLHYDSPRRNGPRANPRRGRQGFPSVETGLGEPTEIPVGDGLRRPTNARYKPHARAAAD